MLLALIPAQTAASEQEKWDIPQALYREIEALGLAPDLATLNALLAKVDAEAARCAARFSDPLPCEEIFNIAAATSGDARDEPEKVRARFDRAIAVSERINGELHETPVALHRTYAHFLIAIGAQQQAEERLRLVIARADAMKSFALVAGLGDLGTLLIGQGRYDEASALLERALELSRAGGWEQQISTLVLRGNMAMLEAEKGNHADAAKTYGEVCPALYNQIGDTWGVATCVLAWGTALVEAGDYERGLQVLTIATNAHDQLFGPAHIQSLLARSQAANAASLKGDFSRADELLRRNRVQLEKPGLAASPSIRALLYTKDAQHVLRASRSLALARQLLILAQAETELELASIGAFDNRARRGLSYARPMFVDRVETSWKLAKGS